VAAILLWPVLPTSCEAVLAALGQPPDDVALADATWAGGVACATVVPPAPLFPRIDADEVTA
jgi:methionyl-tRNA synthetase